MVFNWFISFFNFCGLDNNGNHSYFKGSTMKQIKYDGNVSDIKEYKARNGKTQKEVRFYDKSQALYRLVHVPDSFKILSGDKIAIIIRTYKNKKMKY